MKHVESNWHLFRNQTEISFLAICHCICKIITVMMIHLLFIHPFYIIADEAFRENEWAEAANALLSEMVSIRNQIKIANTLDIQLANGVLLKMVKVEKGTFMMGKEDNYYRHEVTISHDYWIGCYEITRIQ